MWSFRHSHSRSPQRHSTSTTSLEPLTTAYSDEDVSSSDKSRIQIAVESIPNLVEEEHSRCHRSSIWSSFFPSADKELEGVVPLLASNGSYPKCRGRTKSFKRSKLSHWFLFSTLIFFVMLGILQFISLVCGIVISFFPDEFDRAADHWVHRGESIDDISHWPTDVSRDINPVGCHSHNDYWRRVPLYSALQAGCVGVEADVWLFDEELYVGHTTSALTPGRTLRRLYVEPLMDLLERQNPITRFHPAADRPLNGVFDTDPSQTLVLLIDFKTDGAATWPHVLAQLSPLRERGYLTYFNGKEVVNGPITVVGTGNTPFDLLMANSTYRDIFFDAPLDMLAEDDTAKESQTITTKRSNHNEGQGLTGMPDTVSFNTFNSTNSYYASVSFRKSIGIPWRFRLTQKQMDRIRAQVRGAHNRGLKVRYWALPSWPRSLRNHVWTVLVQEGVDTLNVDDLQGATRKEWKPKVFSWF